MRRVGGAVAKGFVVLVLFASALCIHVAGLMVLLVLLTLLLLHCAVDARLLRACAAATATVCLLGRYIAFSRGMSMYEVDAKETWHPPIDMAAGHLRPWTNRYKSTT